jgi:hypothetical protein
VFYFNIKQIENFRKFIKWQIEEAKKDLKTITRINTDSFIKNCNIDGSYDIEVKIDATDEEITQILYEFDNYMLERNLK